MMDFISNNIIMFFSSPELNAFRYVQCTPFGSDYYLCQSFIIYFKKSANMIPNDPGLLLRLVKTNTSFLVYGQKASGKTKLVHRLLKDAQARYIDINCTLTSKKQNFLWLVNVELRKHIKKMGIDIDPLGQPTNLDSWITHLKNLVNQRRDIVEALDNLYLFMDNIEELAFNQTFIASFYIACQKEFPFRFSFIFCGINFLRKEYTLDLPFRTMISFCMPKPIHDFNQIIEGTVLENFRKKYSLPQNIIQKCAKYLSKQIKVSFEDIQTNLEKIRTIAIAVCNAVFVFLDTKQPYKSLSGLVNKGELKKIIQQIVEHGPLQENMLKTKMHAIDGDQPLDYCQNLEYYPQLILSSIHMADYYPQKQDKRRFQDYKGRTNYRNKDLKRNDFKTGKHNINRIIAIAEALESQAKQNDKEYPLQHHTLDFYATFENLRNENRLKFSANKVTGVVKEEQVKAFIAKCELKYEQFMSS